MSVGVDFDNTLVNYDVLIHLVATERSLISPDTAVSKKRIRDAIWELPNGRAEWQKIQALIYGPRIWEATPSPGATEFLKECLQRGVKVNIISHKTEFASYDETGTNLRNAALSWLNQNCILDLESYGLSNQNVFFEPTRQEKVERIDKLGCTHFIDDLEETFLEATFPRKVMKLLYSFDPLSPTVANVDLIGDWWQMRDYLFCAND